MIFLADLWVTQNDLRDWRQVDEMVRFARDGGTWTAATLSEFAEAHHLRRVSPVIQISRFEDGRAYVHDGHHRAVSTHLSGRGHLRSDEYELTDWRYEHYVEINPGRGWFTPFDPRTHVRLADFAAFKEAVRLRTARRDLSKWIAANTHLYRAERGLVRTVADLARLRPRTRRTAVATV